MKFSIIGAGWYGCHIANQLKQEGHDVTIYQPGGIQFKGASGNNQFRMHLGLHYARSSETRHQSRDGFWRFRERYPQFISDVENNIYLVPKRESLIDFNTYISIMFSSGINIKQIDFKNLEFLNESEFEGAITCEEKMIETGRAVDFFRLSLAKNLVDETVEIQSINQNTSHIFVNGDRYDYCIDATWGGLRDICPGFFFEGTLLCYFKIKDKSNYKFPAITLVDGPLWSIYPTDKPGIFTLSHVVHTPIARSESRSIADSKMRDLSAGEIITARDAMVQHVIQYFPKFLDIFEYIGPQLSIKMKPKIASDNRACSVEFDGRRISINSGKIDNIFHAFDSIVGYTNARD